MSQDVRTQAAARYKNETSGGGAPSGAAGGDLTGTYPNPTIAALAVTAAKIDALAVTTAKIDALAVTTAKINDLAVTTAKINDLAVTTAKIDALAVTGAKIANNTVTSTQLNNVATGATVTYPSSVAFGNDGRITSATSGYDGTHYIRAYHSAATFVTGGALSDIVWDSPTPNNASIEYDTGVFTILQNGVYMISMQLLCTTAGTTTAYIDLDAGGTEGPVLNLTQNVSGSMTYTSTYFVGTTISVQILQAGRTFTTTSTGNPSFFSVTRIG